MSEKRDELLDAVDHACFQCIHMAKPIRAKHQEGLMKKFGIPIGPFGPKPLTEERSGHPAFGWKLSEKAKRDIEAIDHNRRMAIHRLHNIVLD